MNELPYRQIHMDFHTSPLIQGIGSAFNADEFASTLTKAGVNSINLFAKCHHGMYYYPTKIGTMHPELKFDLLGEQIKACREVGIRTCIYTTVMWNEDFCDRHPEWMTLSPDGVLGGKKPFTSDYYGWRFLCLNNREHTEYIKSELVEMYSLYKPAGFWIDIVNQQPCICKTCLTDRRALGLSDDSSADIAHHGRMVEISFMKEIYEFLKGMDSEIGIYFNGHPNEMDQFDKEDLSAKRKRDYNSYVDMESLPSNLWGYTHFVVDVNYLNKYNQELTMMNGKFHYAWGDFGSLRNVEALEYECFRGLANGTKVCVGDQLHPSGEIDKTVYQRIGEVFSQIEAKEHWCYGTKKVAQIGVYSPNKVLGAADESFYGVNAVPEGVYRMLSELHYLFDFVDFQDDISGYEMIILPDNINLPKHVAEKLNAFQGKLLLTGDSGFNLDRTCVERIADAEYNPRYMRITADGVFGALPPMDYAVYEQGVSVRALPNAEVLAYTVNPYFNRTYEHFCSHRQTPPDQLTDEPCIVRNGGVIYIANPLFQDYAVNGCKIYRDIIQTCIELLLPQPLVRSSLPTIAELTLRRQNNKLILHILSYIIQRKCRSLDTIEEKLTLHNQKVSIKTNAKPNKVCLVPQMTELDYSYSDDYTHIEIPRIDGHQMVVIEE